MYQVRKSKSLLNENLRIKKVFLSLIVKSVEQDLDLTWNFDKYFKIQTTIRYLYL